MITHLDNLDASGLLARPRDVLTHRIDFSMGSTPLKLFMLYNFKNILFLGIGEMLSDIIKIGVHINLKNNTCNISWTFNILNIENTLLASTRSRTQGLGQE